MPAAAPQPSEHTVRVEVPGHPYEVRIGHGLLASLGPRLIESSIGRPPVHVMVAHDAALPASLVNTATGSLRAAGFRIAAHPLTADEAQKTMRCAESLLRALALARHERHDPIIALGGGLVGDLAGFAAATYRRGVPLVQCPTTLLAMVDASVGGKTGVNLAIDDSPQGLIKNAAGAFHQPRLVLADTASLASLPERQFRSGLAECIKHSLLSGDAGEEGLFNWLLAEIQSILSRDPVVLGQLIERNVRIKASFVKRDEREADSEGGRALLNLGHTFAHAIETLPGVSLTTGESPLLHGEAVAVGLIAAATCSAAEGLSAFPDTLPQLLAQAGLPTKVRGLPDTSSLISRMSHDKKVAGGSLRLILPLNSFRCIVKRDPLASAVRAAWDAIRA